MFVLLAPRNKICAYVDVNLGSDSGRSRSPKSNVSSRWMRAEERFIQEPRLQAGDWSYEKGWVG